MRHAPFLIAFLLAMSAVHAWTTADIGSPDLSQALRQGDMQGFQLVADMNAFRTHGPDIMIYLQNHATESDPRWDILAGHHKELYRSDPEGWRKVDPLDIGMRYYDYASTDTDFWDDIPIDFQIQTFVRMLGSGRISRVLKFFLGRLSLGMYDNQRFSLAEYSEEDIEEILEAAGINATNLSVEDRTEIIIEGGYIENEDGSRISIRDAGGTHSMGFASQSLRLDDFRLERATVENLTEDTVGISSADRIALPGEDIILGYATGMVAEQRTMEEIADIMGLSEEQAAMLSPDGSDRLFRFIRAEDVRAIKIADAVFDRAQDVAIATTDEGYVMGLRPAMPMHYDLPRGFSCDGTTTSGQIHASHPMTFLSANDTLHYDGADPLIFGNVTTTGGPFRIQQHDECYRISASRQNISIDEHQFAAESDIEIEFSAGKLRCFNLSAVGRYTNLNITRSFYLPSWVGHLYLCIDMLNECRQCGSIRNDSIWLNGACEIEAPDPELPIYTDLVRSEAARNVVAMDINSVAVTGDVPESTTTTGNFRIHEHHGRRYATGLAYHYPDDIITYRSADAEITIQDGVLMYEDVRIFAPDAGTDALEELRRYFS